MKMSQMKWDQCQREDLQMIPKMLNSGWNIMFSGVDVKAKRITPLQMPLDPVMFTKKDKHIWSCKQGWRMADFIGGKLSGLYCNHTTHESLEEILNLKI